MLTLTESITGIFATSIVAMGYSIICIIFYKTFKEIES